MLKTDDVQLSLLHIGPSHSRRFLQWPKFCYWFVNDCCVEQPIWCVFKKRL